MTGKENHSCERYGLLPVSSTIPTCPKLAARLCWSLAMAVSHRLKERTCSQAEVVLRLSQHPLSRIPPSRTAGAAGTHAGPDLSWLPILRWPQLQELFFPPLTPQALTNLSHSFTAEWTHTLSRHHCTHFVHPWEIGSSFFYLLLSTFSTKLQLPKLQ